MMMNNSTVKSLKESLQIYMSFMAESECDNGRHR